MRIKDYLKENVVAILVTTGLLVYVLFYIGMAGTPLSILGFIGISYLVLYIMYLTASYLYRKKKFAIIEKKLDMLEKKYLIADMLKETESYSDNFYREVIRSACKSMMEELTKLENSNQGYAEYIDSWIHEVKTPVTAIQLLCDNERSSVTDKIKLEIKKVEIDIERIMYYSKVDETWKDYVISKQNLKEIVESAIMKGCQILICNRAMLDIQLQDEEVYTDAKWSSFIILQLLLNCVKYKSSRPLVIKVYAKKLKDGTSLVIEDNGVGIHPEEIQRIFEKGYVGTNGRLISTSSGMGLYICKKLCDKLQIGIRAESEYGVYTKLVLTYGEGTFVMPMLD
ncbi:MAG: sensor histidine kinase [Clostridium sp.]|nr:sensor histidine kinase [Clostridium sp.]